MHNNILNYVDIFNSTKTDGNMSLLYDETERVRENRGKFFEKINIDYSKTYIIRTNFENPNLYKYLEELPKQENYNPNVDALITKNKDISLALLTADCMPLTLYDPIEKVIALVHCGWSWVDAGIIDRTISFMHKELNSNPQNILVNMGPTLAKEHYNWDENIFKKIKKDSYVYKSIYLNENDRSEKPYRIDVKAAVLNNLLSMGIERKNILDNAADTYTSDTYFSHKLLSENKEEEKRHMTVVKIK